MVTLLHIAAILLVALAAALSVAHALELPGKMRLSREQYLAVQQVYYPGFTIGGASEPLGTLALVALLYFVPHSAPFWLILAALCCMIGVMTVFWLVTQPVNKVWTKGIAMGPLGSGFFGTGGGAGKAEDWTALRDRWERSHVARAVLATFAFLCVLAALAVRP